MQGQPEVGYGSSKPIRIGVAVDIPMKGRKTFMRISEPSASSSRMRGRPTMFHVTEITKVNYGRAISFGSIRNNRLTMMR